MFMSVDEHAVCALYVCCIKDITPLNHCHLRGEITSGGQEMKLSWRSLRLCWRRMDCGPRLMSVEHCIAFQDSSHGQCFCKSLPARILTWVDCSHSPCSCVNNPLDDSLPPHANIILQNILPADFSKVPLNSEWTLYLFLHITKYISRGAEYHTFKELWMEQCFCFSQSADFSPFATYQLSGKWRDKRARWVDTGRVKETGPAGEGGLW